MGQKDGKHWMTGEQLGRERDRHAQVRWKTVSRLPLLGTGVEGWAFPPFAMNGYTDIEFSLYCLAEAALVQNLLVTCSLLSVSLLHWLSSWEEEITWQGRMLWGISGNRRCLKSGHSAMFPSEHTRSRGNPRRPAGQPSPPLLPALSLSGLSFQM